MGLISDGEGAPAGEFPVDYWRRRADPDVWHAMVRMLVLTAVDVLTEDAFTLDDLQSFVRPLDASDLEPCVERMLDDGELEAGEPGPDDEPTYHLVTSAREAPMTDGDQRQQPTWTVDGAELSTALARIVRVVGKGRGVGTWVLTPTMVILEWSGAHEEVQAKGTGSLIVTFTPAVMKNLASLVPATSPVTIHATDARLRINTTAISCTVVSSKPPELLTVDASDLDILLLGLRHTADDLERAGLNGDVEQAEGRRNADVEEVAARLGWLGIDAGLLARWVTAHLSARAKGQATFELGRPVVVDERGQVALFETARRRSP